ncbi:Putative Amine oxidase [Podospora comata]|uniref:Amine oxidase n=1 Tax=Podospora comata TaxID=48703 RepID=A0ABY6S9Q7_PODCO|nr:Putative Amine oxidase [Podospora comata]
MSDQIQLTNHKQYDVIVVGAGLSGLQTAVKVRHAGFSVIILEALDRVGGKTLSVQSSSQGKGVNDLGAAWINDSSQSEIYKLFLEAGLKPEKQLDEGNTLRQIEDGSYISVPFGQLFVDEEEAAAFAVLFGALRKVTDASDLEDPITGPDAKRLDSLTFAEYCKELLDSPSTPIIATSLARALLGVEGDEVSALFMINYFKSGTGILNLVSDGPDGGQYLRANKGTQTISKYLAAQLPSGSIHLTSVVKSVSQSAAGVEVVTTANKTFRAARAVVSLPSALYPTISFSPALPPSKSILAEGTAIGAYGKIIYVWAIPWWREAGLSGTFEAPLSGHVSFTRETSVPEDNQWSITCFIVGDPARELSKYAQKVRREKVWAQFKQVFEGSGVLKGAKVPEPIQVHEIAWKRNQYADGAPTAVMGPGMLTELGEVTVNPLREPWRRVHFVGTETSLVWKGYMDGAVRSGIRGGEEVVKALREEGR